MIGAARDAVKRARKLRSEMTLPETMLWRRLRGRPDGLKFRRQHPAVQFVLDFYCAAARLDIEVDGWAHDNPRNSQADANRSQALRSQGIATRRVPAPMILKDIDTVVTRIVEICRSRIAPDGSAPVPLHHLAGGPPLHTGEEQ
jgi:very-short-patch-repair endonuclease